jgi:hypothetical protein
MIVMVNCAVIRLLFARVTVGCVVFWGQNYIDFSPKGEKIPTCGWEDFSCIKI